MTPGERFWTDAGMHWLNDRLELTPESRVIDVGGYHGDWSAYIADKFDCFIEVYEPVEEFRRVCAERFHSYPKIRVYSAGVEGKTERRPIALMNDGSSMYNGSPEKGVVVDVLDAAQLVSSMARIDLLALNCEGSEYSILERLINTGEIRRIDDVLVQFHEFVPNAATRREAIRISLAESYQETMCYPFVWENWKRR